MMKPEVSLAAVALLSLLGALLVHDYVRSQNSRRVLAVQGAVFAVGGALIVYPDIATRLAHAVGIGRGVDFVIYPLVIWLVRESLLSRRRRREDDERMTELVRAVASERARVVHSSGRAPEQSAASSAS
jgi:hypothetical protein